ncbi:c-type cytochrome, partial [Prosthecobacter sp.]|jgi:putative heme-binding domain-containing protein|uniref:DUF7133 domain-containing protein n=1 Tax=Prosthecobacter sp. TaxID=1965333 RepID=UPI0037C922BB
VKGAVEGGGRVSGYFTGATGTTIYRGDAYGPDFVNNSFTGDAGGQLVHRKIIKPSADGISLIGERPADEHGFEFAASKDTWVRVVNFANAPDGCLHICDMYREVIEHPWSIPDEIKKHIDLNNGNDRGRIYRIVPDKGAERIGQKVALDKASTEELVKTLGHPNGWHRDTAQRLLFERKDKAAVPLLEKVLSGDNALAKLHALGALQGLGALNEAHVVLAMQDANEQVVISGIRLSEQFFDAKKVPHEDLIKAWGTCCHTSQAQKPTVRYQLALSAAKVYASIRTFDPAKMTYDDKLAKMGEYPLAVLHGNNSVESDAKILDAFLSSSPDASLLLLGVLAFDMGDLLLPEPAFVKTLQASASSINLPQQWFIEDPRKWTPARLVALVADHSSPERVAALAKGFRQAGSSLEKADVEGKLTPVFTKAAMIVADPKASEGTRLEAIKLLGLTSAKEATDALTQCLAQGQPDAIQSAAIHTLSQGNSPAITESLIAGWAAYGPKAKEAALEALLAREDRALALLESGAVKATEFSASQVQALLKHKSPKVAASAKTALASVIPPSREEVTAKFKPAIAAQGDAKKGQLQYMARCVACHRAGTMGLQVGPDLITVKTKGREALLTAILEPHKEVASQFIAYTVNTKDGQTLAGIITNDTASSMSLKMMGGIEKTLQRSEIKGSSSTGQSLMPEGLETGMSVADMADLLSFIEGQ